jgi:hypothetical protein
VDDFFIGGTPLDDAPLVFLVYICAEGTGAMEVPLTCLPALPRIAFAVIVGVLFISRPDVDVDGMFNDVLGSSGEAQGDGDAGGPTGSMLNDVEATGSTNEGGGISQLSSISRLSFLFFLFLLPFSFSPLTPFTFL